MTHTRDELLKMMLTAKAIAAVCEAELKAQMRRNCDDNRTFDTWKIPGFGQVIASQSQDRAEIVDRAALIAWVEANYPTEVHTVTVKEIRNPGWLSKLLEDLAPVTPPDVDDDWEPKPGDQLPARDAEGSIVPGVQWQMGGQYVTTSIRPDPARTKQLAVRAREFVTNGRTLPALTGGAPAGDVDEEAPR